jgi:hypothetical protein
MKRSLWIVIVVGIVLGATGLRAAEPLKATITGVDGFVQVRDAEDGPWKKAAVGMVIGEGAEFRTGPKSAVRFEIPPDQTISLDRLGTVKLMEAVRGADKVKTDLGMRYGRVRYDIEAAGLAHDSTIHSPGATLAVRGTKVSLYDQPPFTPQAISLTGVARFRNSKNRIVKVGGEGKASVNSDQSSVAENNFGSTSIHSESLQQVEQQYRELSFLASHKGRTLGNVGASNVAVTDAELPHLLSGNLDFVLRWSGPHNTFSDLNILVTTPLGETFGNAPFLLSLFPNNPQFAQFLKDRIPSTTKSGGSVGLNSIGPEGIEIASFGKTYPTGVYVVSAYNFLPPDPSHSTGTGVKVPFTIDVFQNGQRQSLIINLNDVLHNEAQPQFGLQYQDSIAIGEIGSTAVQIQPSDTGGGTTTGGNHPAAAVAAKRLAARDPAPQHQTPPPHVRR